AAAIDAAPPEHAQPPPPHAPRLRQRDGLDVTLVRPSHPAVSAPSPDTSSAGADLPPEPSIHGYRILRELGRGGMGVVHAARDDRSGQNVALKAMLYLDPVLLVRFKQEFRYLATIKHPNLISLYKLEADGPVWFYTMELLEGAVGFLSHVRGSEGERCPPTPAQIDRLRDAFAQLADGLDALHAAGIIHRDLKPGTVPAPPEGRVVLLAFGLAGGLARGGLPLSNQPRLLGTIGYVSPEQAACQAVSPASDWYSAGVMLFEALTNRLPFTGPPLRVLQDKQSSAAPDPR